MLQKSPMYAYIPVKDMKRAREFYEKKLGVEPKMEIAGGLVYEFAGGTACFMYPTPNGGTSRANQAYWEVADIESEVAELKARGVVFDNFKLPGQDANGIMTHGAGKAAWFKDSEGNTFALIQSA